MSGFGGTDYGSFNFGPSSFSPLQIVTPTVTEQDTLRFVDAIADAPNIRLNLNDGFQFSYTGLSMSPPELKRAFAGTLLADGEEVPATAYANRVIDLDLTVLAGSADGMATAIQQLMRELNRDGNLLMWRPAAATFPVWFETLRCSPDELTHFASDPTVRTLRLAIPCRPFAIGAREDLDPVTVVNDPEGGGMVLDVAGVKGDVPAPLLLRDLTSVKTSSVLAVRQHGNPSDLPWWVQAEDCQLGPDTIPISGALPHSGPATKNFVSVDFSSTTGSVPRLSWSALYGLTPAQSKAMRGTFRVMMSYRRSNATDVIRARLAVLPDPILGAPVKNTYTTLPLTTNRLVADLGLVTIGGALPVRPGRFGAEAPFYTTSSVLTLQIEIQRVSGTGAVYPDVIYLLPADESVLMWDSGGSYGSYTLVDGETESVYAYDTDPDPFDGAGELWADNPPFKVVGGFPQLRPNEVNRLFVVQTEVEHATTVTSDLAVSYYPRYLSPSRPS